MRSWMTQSPALPAQLLRFALACHSLKSRIRLLSNSNQILLDSRLTLSKGFPSAGSRIKSQLLTLCCDGPRKLPHRRAPGGHPAPLPSWECRELAPAPDGGEGRVALAVSSAWHALPPRALAHLSHGPVASFRGRGSNVISAASMICLGVSSVLRKLLGPVAGWGLVKSPPGTCRTWCVDAPHPYLQAGGFLEAPWWD